MIFPIYYTPGMVMQGLTLVYVIGSFICRNYSNACVASHIRQVMPSIRLDTRLRLSFVIPALDEEIYIEDCIRSIQAQRDQLFENIVVDNGCVDRTVALAENLECIVVREHRPAGDWLEIVNPSAGHHTHRSLHAISRRLQRELAVSVAITRSYGQIAELLGSIAWAGGVAVYGGDGAIAEVVNNMQLERQRLLVFPAAPAMVWRAT